jgi:hypothetical protein
MSKKDGLGQIILTQKRLYFLLETHSFALLLTELTNIKSIDKYQHRIVFSSSKPAIKIHTLSTSSTSSLPRDNNLTLKSKSSIRLLFTNNQEQKLWYAIIMELWSGLTIAHEQCDTAVLNKASRHVALMDTLANIDYDEETRPLANTQLINTRQKSRQRHNEVII